MALTLMCIQVLPTGRTPVTQPPSKACPQIAGLGESAESRQGDARKRVCTRPGQKHQLDSSQVGLRVKGCACKPLPMDPAQGGGHTHSGAAGSRDGSRTAGAAGTSSMHRGRVKQKVVVPIPRCLSQRWSCARHHYRHLSRSEPAPETLLAACVEGRGATDLPE